jgi:hypothetical protein
MIHRIVLFLILFPSFLFAQYTTTYGNLMRIPFDAGQINPADTMGSWIHYSNSYADGFTQYEDVIHTPQSTYFEKFKQDDYINYGLVTELFLEEFTNQTSDSYGSWSGYYDILEPYVIWETYPFRIENGTWLINGVYNLAFLSDEDKITILPREYYNDLLYICTKIDGKYLTVFRKDTQEPAYKFYLLDLSGSPEFDTTGAVQVYFDPPAAPYKMRKLLDSLYIAGVDSLPYSYDHKLNLYRLENSTFHYIKTFIDDVTEDWEYRDSSLYLLSNNNLGAMRFNPADTSFYPAGIILPLGDNFAVSRDYSAAVKIVGDTSLEIFNPGLINTVDISKINTPKYPFIDSPYVYIHQAIRVTDLKEKTITPLSYNLQVYPNPFNPSTNIVYTLPQRNNVEIKLYDILGREVKNIYSGESDAGSHQLILVGSGLASGIYLIRFTSDRYSVVQKIILLK